jgi:hypothetical protein
MYLHDERSFWVGLFGLLRRISSRSLGEVTGSFFCGLGGLTFQFGQILGRGLAQEH